MTQALPSSQYKSRYSNYDVPEEYVAVVLEQDKYLAELGRLCRDYDKDVVNTSYKYIQPAIHTLIELAICVPDIDIDQFCPCPFREVAKVLGLNVSNSVVRDIVYEMQGFISDDIDAVLTRNKIDVLYDFRPTPLDHILLTGVRKRKHGTDCSKHTSG